MKNNWQDSELILALRLYYQLPFGKMHSGNKDIIKLANIINRTPSAVAMKLVNFARFDQKLKNRNISGLKNGSKKDEIIWNSFINLDKLEEESDNIIEKMDNKILQDLFVIDDTLENLDIKTISKGRKKQSFFRKQVLANFDGKCCITGLSILPLLVASHITPWSKDEKNRLNPQNGLLLNSIHDKAFDQGLITINIKFEIILSEQIKSLPSSDFVTNTFLRYENKSIILPEKYLPSEEFIIYHNNNIFKNYGIK